MNSVLFKLLFAHLVELSLSQSVPDDCDSNQADQELAFYKIERIGFQVGQRLMDRLTIGHRILVDQLDVFKYICKDYWSVIFNKQIDNLKTNHKGVYVLLDNDFSWIAPFASDISMPDTAKMTVLYLAFPCGLIRGALASFGIVANVTAEIPAFNQCHFQVRVSASELP